MGAVYARGGVNMQSREQRFELSSYENARDTAVNIIQEDDLFNLKRLFHQLIVSHGFNKEDREKLLSSCLEEAD